MRQQISVARYDARETARRIAPLVAVAQNGTEIATRSDAISAARLVHERLTSKNVSQTIRTRHDQADGAKGRQVREPVTSAASDAAYGIRDAAIVEQVPMEEAEGRVALDAANGEDRELFVD